MQRISTDTIAWSLKKPLTIWGDLTSDDLDYRRNKLPAKGLLLIPVVKDNSPANIIWEKFNI